MKKRLVIRRECDFIGWWWKVYAVTQDGTFLINEFDTRQQARDYVNRWKEGDLQ